MKILIAKGAGVWGSCYGIEVATDKNLIELREKYTNEEWQDFIYKYRDKIDDAFYEMEHFPSFDKIGLGIFDEEEKKLHNILLKYFADDTPPLEFLANLAVEEVPKGKKFKINDSDYGEWIEIYTPKEWYVAKE